MSEIKPHYDKQRSVLADVIPLPMPYSIQIEASQVCNLKCSYCMQSFVPDHGRELMTMHTFTRICQRIMEFDGKLKTVNFAGWGEPLVNPDLPAMIRHLKECDVTDKIAIITNGVLLYEKKVLDLIAAGVDHIRISLQGMDTESYRKIGGKRVNFDALVDQIKFLWVYKQGCRVSVKIADISLKDGDEQKFYDTFGPITNDMYIEHIRPMFKENEQDGKLVSKYGNEHKPVMVCPMPFFMMAITATGDILPCCSYYDPLMIGGIKGVSLKKAWGDRWTTAFRLMMLKKQRKDLCVCDTCKMPDATITPGDELDDRAEEIKERL